MTTSRDFRSAVRGCIIGGALGDALGAATEGMYYPEIEHRFGRLETFQPCRQPYTNGTLGTVTDDTVMRSYLCFSIRERRGRITASEFADALLRKLDERRLWVNERIVRDRLAAGISPHLAGRGGIPCGCAVMHIAPIGVVNAGNPRQAADDARLIASVTSDGDNVDFAASFAAAQAAAFRSACTVEDLVDSAMEAGTDIVRRALTRTLALVRQCVSVDEFKRKFYERFLDWTWPLPPGAWTLEKDFSGESREFVPVVFALLTFFPDEAERAVLEAANFGRDCDTIASLVGNLAGTLHGEGAWRREWTDLCEEANRDLFEALYGDPSHGFSAMADDLVGAVDAERERLAAYLAALDAIRQGNARLWKSALRTIRSSGPNRSGPKT